MDNTNTTMRDTIVNTYNLGSLPSDQQDNIVERIGSLIFQAILIRTIPMLSESKQEELEKLLEDNATPDQMLGFLNNEVPNFSEIVGEESDKFKRESDAVMSKLG